MSNYPPDPSGQESWNNPPPEQPGAVPGGMPAGAAPPPGALYYTTVDKDASDLRTLSIFWYIVAGLQALATCLILLYFVVVLGFTLIGGAAGASSNEPGAAVPIVGVGAMFLCFLMIPLATVATFAYLNYTVAKSLVARKNLTLIYVMAGIMCLGLPLGTVLGVFTFITLSRPSIKASFI